MLKTITQKVLPISLLIIIALQGCSIHHNPDSPQDPYEKYNRAMFKFNKVVDKVAMQPVAVAYNKFIPSPVKTGVSNVFDNIYETSVMANDLLQGKFLDFISSTWRLILNSTVGVAGLFDVAKHVGLPKQEQDFGKTLAIWGDIDSPYFVIPIFGPSTVRDASGFIFDYNIFNVMPHTKPLYLRNTLYGMQLVDLRYRLLGADRIANAAAVDEYLFVRNAYLQYRKNQLVKANIIEDTDEEDDIYVE